MWVCQACRALAMSMLLTACGAQKQTAPAPEDNPAKQTVFKEMVEAEDRARAVQGTVDQHKQQLDQALEAAEGQAQDK